MDCSCWMIAVPYRGPCANAAVMSDLLLRRVMMSSGLTACNRTHLQGPGERQQERQDVVTAGSPHAHAYIRADARDAMNAFSRSWHRQT
jgi:hypothetical protein